MKKTEEIRLSFKYFPKPHLILLSGLFLLLAISQLMMKSMSEKEIIPLDLILEESSISAEQTSGSPATESWLWREEKVQSGDNLSTIFKRVGVSATTLHDIMSSNGQADQLTKIYPGHLFRFAFDEHNQLMALQYIPSKLARLDIFRQQDNSFTFEEVAKEPEVRLAYKYAVIDDSLFLAGQNAGISQGMIMQVANVFGGVVDFVYDPRKGDSFDVLYEEEFLEGEKIGNGKLLAASYTNRGEIHTAFRYEFDDGRIGYFNPEGISMRKPFLRAPLDFTRISSGFNLKRKHPVHKKIRAHRGIDYAAPTGTPIFAAGDGRVTRAGYSKANGNYVFIQHGPEYTTKYLHLHKRYVKTGQKVKQRTVIGTVGATGYATGPHLHYEFLVNGVHRNPKTIFKKLPSADPIPEEEKARFEMQIKSLQLQYSNYQFATNNG